MVVSIAGVATGWIRVSPLQQTGMPGCGLGLRPHHIDEQKERSPPSSSSSSSSDRNGTLTLVTASAGSGLATQPCGGRLSFWAATVQTPGSAFCSENLLSAGSPLCHVHVANASR